MISKLCCLSTQSCKGQCLGLGRNQNIKLTYLTILILVMVFSFLTNYTNSNQHPTDQQVQEYHCSDIQPDYQSQCITQKQTTLNFLALAVFHFVLFLALLPKTNHVKVVNQGIWIIKLVLVAGLILLISYTLGPSISSLTSFLSVTLSPLLFIITNIVLIDNVYFIDFKVNSLCEKYNKLHIVKMGLAIVLWVLAIVLNVLSYYQSELWVSVGTSVVIGVMMVVALLRVARNNSLFVYALTMLHVVLISYTIHSQHPHNPSSWLNQLQHPYRIFVLISTLFCMLFQGGNQIRTKNSTLNEILALNTSRREEDNRYVSSNKWIVYHLMMVLIVFTLPIISSYDYEATETSSRNFIDIGKLIWWGSAVLIYLWSVLVQKIYPEQDFSELQNYFKEFELN